MSPEESQSIKQCMVFVKALKAQPLGGLFPNDQNRVKWALQELEMVFRPYLDGTSSEDNNVPKPNFSKQDKSE